MSGAPTPVAMPAASTTATQPPASAWNTDQWASLARTGFKMLGSVLVTVGVLDASQGAAIAGPLVDAVVALIGTGSALYGVFQSFWHHSPV